MLYTHRKRSATRLVSTLLLMAAVGLMMVACSFGNTPASNGGTKTPTTATIPEVAIKATEFSYTMPAQLSSGLTHIVITNDGKQSHGANFLRLNDDVTPQQLLDAMKENPMEAFTKGKAYGGFNIPAGKSAEFTVNLATGNYLLFSLNAQGENDPPDMTKGMSKAFVVAKSTATAAPEEPKADAQIALLDFGFETPETLPTKSTLLKVTNQGQQPHEISVFRLSPGKTVDDLKTYFSQDNPSGPPPAEEVGSITLIGKDVTNWTHVQYPAGNYAFVCFLPDPKTGQPHFMLGMIKGVTVK